MQVDSVRAKIIPCTESMQNNISKNETKEDPDSTGISQGDCENCIVPSLHCAFLLRHESGEPASRITSHEARAGAAQIPCFSVVVPVPVVGPTRGGL